ncbi:paraquat-inducible protein A [Luteolibacter marinus]|uniref:paraquat-inducible protein A n=1 Tax=Luteolibacter marinus TaxID=2776705 RepID=UPI001867EFAC|nr:paraquat-inducible protein A [Luteolibacter marinus]
MTPPRSAAADGLASCHLCGKVSPVTLGHCPRCHSTLHLRKPHSLARTWAFLVAALAFYLPANLLPMMTIGGFGGDSSDTIMSGVINFWHKGDTLVAAIIFTASILIPILKMLALVWLCLAASGVTAASPKALSRLYHLTELVGRWSMVDVFVVAILVCLVQIGAISTVTPGPAIVSFAAVVVLTMFAAMSFDPRLLWDRQHGIVVDEPADLAATHE